MRAEKCPFCKEQAERGNQELVVHIARIIDESHEKRVSLASTIEAMEGVRREIARANRQLRCLIEELNSFPGKGDHRLGLLEVVAYNVQKKQEMEDYLTELHAEVGRALGVVV